MGNNFFLYLERLELMAFFAAYPLLYAFIHVAAVSRPFKTNSLVKLASLLPYAYALCGSLYLGLQLKNLWPNLSPESLGTHFSSWLKFWGLLAVLFWIPALSRRPLLSLLHSLLVFFFLLKDLYLHSTSQAGKEIVRNDMKIFTDSIILNVASLLIITVIYFIQHTISSRQKKGTG